MSIQLHEEVILARDVSMHRLHVGDVGTVVRTATDDEVIAVRTLDPTG